MGLLDDYMDSKDAQKSGQPAPQSKAGGLVSRLLKKKREKASLKSAGSVAEKGAPKYSD